MSIREFKLERYFARWEFTVFDFGDSHLRFGLGRRNFPDGLAVLEKYLAAN